jgi:hypothetical protein
MAVKVKPAYLPKFPHVIEVAMFTDADALRALVIEWLHPGFRHFWAYRTDGSGVLCLQWAPEAEPESEKEPR